MSSVATAGDDRTRALVAAVVCGRLVVGGLALVAPRRLGRIIDIRVDGASPLPYVARLFGVRAVGMALAVAGSRGADRGRQLRAGVAVDLVDAAAAVASGRSGDLDRRAAAMVFAAAVTEMSLGLAALRGGATRCQGR